MSREIDKDIAEKIFGDTVYFRSDDAWEPEDDYFYTEQAGDDEIWEAKDRVPYYSSDISAAFDVWSELTKTHCCLNLDADYEYWWKVSLTKINKNNAHKITSTGTSTNSITEAICEAVLDSVKITS